MESLGVTSETYTPSSVIGGDHPQIRKSVTIASGQGVLPSGQVLGVITASGEYGAYNNGHSDGTEVADCILEHAVDATSTSIVGIALDHAEVNVTALTGLDANARADLRGRIYFKTNAS